MKWPFLSRRCAQRGHDWFPMLAAREFIPVSNVCLRCGEENVMLPWGQCLSGHPIAEHYDAAGQLVTLEECPGPR